MGLVHDPMVGPGSLVEKDTMQLQPCTVQRMGHFALQPAPYNVP